MEKNHNDNTFKSMAKSSGIVAFVQVFQMFFSLLRNKVIALLVGASGFGLWSLLQTLLEMFTTFSTFGLDQGGVREIAKEANEDKRAKCVFTFRITIFCISLLMSLILWFSASFISELFFHTSEYSSSIRILSVIIIFYGLSKGGYAILNGFRSLRYLAISQIASAILGSLGAIFIIYFFGREGIPYALSIVYVTAAIVTFLFVRKLKIRLLCPRIVEFKTQLKSLLYLGFGFTIGGVVATIMTFLSRSFLNKFYSLDAVGIYQACWTVSNLYIGIILTAMGIDFMPRLSKVSNDNTKMNDLINQQILFGISLATLGGVLVLLFAPILLKLLYSSEFVIGENIIRWQILGVMLRVVAFPFSYSIMAKGKALQYAFAQIFIWTSDYMLLMLFSNLWGFNALGINYSVAYLFYFFLILYFCKRNHGFKFTESSRKILGIMALFISLFWILTKISEGWLMYVSGLLLWSIMLIIINRMMAKIIHIDLFSFVKQRIRK